MIVLNITPIPKPRMTQRDRWAKRPVVLRYHGYADELRRLWGGEPVPDVFWITFYMPMPSSWSQKKKQQMDGEPHQQRPDVDNLLKAFLDALCDDDSFVWDVRSRKLWSSQPRIEVTILED